MPKFSEKDVVAVAKIGFDAIEGPVLKEFRKLDEKFNVDIEKLLVIIYLWFMGGSGDSPRPRFIVLDDFSIAAFPDGTDVTCIFVRKDEELLKQISSLPELVKGTTEKTTSERKRKRRKRRRRRR